MYYHVVIVIYVENNGHTFFAKFCLSKPMLLYYSPSNRTLFFGNNIKSKMQILNLIGNIYLNQKTLIQNIFGSLHAFS